MQACNLVFNLQPTQSRVITSDFQCRSLSIQPQNSGCSETVANGMKLLEIENFERKIGKWNYENSCKDNLDIRREIFLFSRNLLLHSHNKFSEIQIRSFDQIETRHKFVSAVRMNEHVTGCCQTQQYIGWHVVNVSSMNLLSFYHACRFLFGYTLLTIC